MSRRFLHILETSVIGLVSGVSGLLLSAMLFIKVYRNFKRKTLLGIVPVLVQVKILGFIGTCFILFSCNISRTEKLRNGAMASILTLSGKIDNAKAASKWLGRRRSKSIIRSNMKPSHGVAHTMMSAFQALCSSTQAQYSSAASKS